MDAGAEVDAAPEVAPYLYSHDGSADVAELAAPAGSRGESSRAPVLPGPGSAASDPGAGGGGTALLGAGAKRRLAALQARFRSCFSRALNTNPDLNGRFFFDITYDPRGKVTAVRANDRTTSELRGGDLERCLLAAIQRTSFVDSSNPVTKPVTFTLPVQLKSQ